MKPNYQVIIYYLTKYMYVSICEYIGKQNCMPVINIATYYFYFNYLQQIITLFLILKYLFHKDFCFSMSFILFPVVFHVLSFSTSTQIFYLTA